jgi:hypothetical protein
MKYSSLLIVLAGTILTACTKHKGDIADHVPVASLAIVKPVEGSVFSVGDTVVITGTAISDENIHGYDVIVKKANDTATYFSVHIHDHNDTLVINQKWKVSVSKSALEALITVVLDHDGHALTRRAGFGVN